MAAGNSLTVKLRYRSQLPSSELATQDGRDIKNSVMAMAMASDSEEAVHDSDLQQPLDPLSTSSDHGDPTSIPPPAMMPLTTVAMLSQRRRRKHSASLKRSASTPNVRGLMDGDVGMTLAEKRRNKLGYHRTSVACGMFSSVDLQEHSLSFFFRTLQTAQNKMLARSGRRAQQMCQLHPTEERLQFLPGRPATPARETTSYLLESRHDGVEFIGFFASLGGKSSSISIGSYRRI